MNVNIEYKVGQEISYNYERKELCHFCGGEGSIYGWDGSKMICPVCNGAKGFSYNPRDIFVDHSKIVGIFVKYDLDMEEPELYYRVERPAGEENKVYPSEIIGLYEEPVSEI